MAPVSPTQRVGKLHQRARVEPRVLSHSSEVSQHQVSACSRQTLNDCNSLTGNLREGGERLFSDRAEFAGVEDAPLTAVQVGRLHSRPRIDFSSPAKFIHDSRRNGGSPRCRGEGWVTADLSEMPVW